MVAAGGGDSRRAGRELLSGSLHFTGLAGRTGRRFSSASPSEFWAFSHEHLLTVNGDPWLKVGVPLMFMFAQSWSLLVRLSSRPGPLRLQEVMPDSPENIPLGECTLSQSRDQLTPPSRTESTVFSLSRSESLWTAEQADRCEVFWFPIHLMSTGGSFLACGIIISGLYFAGHCRKVTNILGPALLSIGLMVFVVGVVLIPITKENRKRSNMKKPLSYYRPPVFNL